MPPSFSSLQGCQVGRSVHADVASSPRVGISAGIPARVRGVRDGGGGSAPDPEDSQIWSRLIVVWMTAVVLSHIFVLGCGWFFVDALMVMLLVVMYLLLARRHSHWGEPESVGTTAALQTHKK